VHSLLVFLLLPRPPFPTLCPYTSLFRSLPVRISANGSHFIDRRTDSANPAHALYSIAAPGAFATLGIPLIEGRDFDDRDTFDARSEEHTSELQSRGHLVCRLLLEKKNKT